MIWPALFLPVLCLRSESCTFDNSSTILVVSREPDNFTHVSDSLPELCNCTYATASSCCCSCQNESTNMEEYFLCSSLTDALDEVSEMANLSSVAILLGGENSTAYYILSSYCEMNRSLASFHLIGFGEVGVVCDIGGKLVVSNAQQVKVENVAWRRCGINSSEPLAAVTIQNCPVVTFNYTHFLNSGTSAIFVSSTEELPNDAKIVLKFLHSTYSHNGNHVQYINGAGVNIQLTTSSSNEVTIEFEDCQFISNQAKYGGAVYVAVSSQSENSQILFYHCSFLYNIVESNGGAVCSFGGSSSFENCTFVGNRADSVAGAVYQVPLITTSACQLQFQFLWCWLENNTAAYSAAIYTDVTSQFLSQNSHLTQEITDCNFVHNSVDEAISRGQTNCILSVRNVNSVMMENVLVAESLGSAMCLRSSSLKIQGNVTIDSNIGYYGGGMYMYDSSLNLNQNSTLFFIRNKATLGGALFIEMLPNDTVTECGMFFANQSSEVGLSKIYFIENTAVSFGDAIYLADPQISCNLTAPEFVYEPNTQSKIATGACTIFFNEPVQANGGQNLSLNLTLGQVIVLNVNVTDHFNHSSQVGAFVALIPLNNDNYCLVGVQTISLENGTNNLNMYVKGKPITTPINDHSLLFVAKEFIITIQLVLNPCQAGFEYDSSTSVCTCVQSPSIVECDSQTGTACIKQGYWVGEYENTTQYVTAPCTADACTNTNEQCSECMLSSGGSLDITRSCVLPPNSSNQCLGSRAGVVCSECSSNYSFTFGATDCAPSETCSGGKAAFVPLVDIGFLLFTVVTLIFLLKTGYRIRSGHLFSFVYYFSIIKYLLPSAEPAITNLRIIVSVFQSLTQLTPTFLGYVPLCFTSGLTPLEHQAILYFNPVLVSLLIAMFLILSRYCSVLVQFKDNTPVKAICLLLLLSFTAITTISFTIINPTDINGVEGRYVFIQPTTKYLDLEDHLPWFVLAVFFLVVLVLPFTLLILVSPFLVRCFNLTRIKPFLDEFQGCYKDRYRFMAAYYFICRLCYIGLLTTPFVSLYYVQTQYMVQLMSFLFLMIHVTMQPYQSGVLNLIDTVLLADIVLVTLLFGETANLVFQNVTTFRAVLAYILVFVPILIMFLSILSGLQRMFLSRKLHDYYTKFFSSKQPSSGVPDSTIVTISDEGNRSSSNSLREPLLSLLEEDEIYTPSKVRANSVRNERSLSFQHRRQRTSYTVVDRPWISRRRETSLPSCKDIDNSRHSKGSHSRTSTISSQNWQELDAPQEGDEL